MELSRLEEQRTGLVQFLLFLVIVFLGVVSFISFQKDQGYLILSLCVIALGACLYVIAKERSYKEIHGQLISEIHQKDFQVMSLNEDLLDERTHLTEEKEKTDHLGVRLNELTAFYRAISIVNSVKDHHKVPNAVLDAALELVDTSSGSIMLVDDKREYLFFVSTWGLSGKADQKIRQRVGEGVAGWVVENGEPLLLKGDIKNDERFKNVTQREWMVSSSLLAPLKVRDTVIGILNLTHPFRAKEKEFSQRDLRIVSIFSQHASIAIENGKLIEKIQKLKISSQAS